MVSRFVLRCVSRSSLNSSSSGDPFSVFFFVDRGAPWRLHVPMIPYASGAFLAHALPEHTPPRTLPMHARARQELRTFPS